MSILLSKTHLPVKCAVVVERAVRNTRFVRLAIYERL